MPYLGNTPPENFVNVVKQDITGNGGQSYSLNHAVSSAADLEVFVNNVQQEPTTAYTVSGSTLTFDEAVSATDDIYVIFRARSIGTATHPATQPLSATTGTFSGDLTVDTNTLHVDAANNRVGVGESSPADKIHSSGDIRLTSGASTTRRVYALSGGGAYSLNSSGGAAIAFHRDASNNDEIAFETHTQGTSHAERMRINAYGHVTMPSQPSFCARLLASTTTAGAKWPTNGTPQHNVGNHWSTSTHRFTCPVSGRYLLLCSGYTNFTTGYGYMNLYINGTNQGSYSRHFNHNGSQQHDGMSMNVIFDLNANDYVEWGRGGAGSGTFDIVNVAAYLLS